MKKLILAIGALALLLSAPLDGEAASKKKKSKRSDYTTEQQKKIYEYALRECRKKYGVGFHRVEINYARNRFVCWIY